jgi:hypothetical protein
LFRRTGSRRRRRVGRETKIAEVVEPDRARADLEEPVDVHVRQVVRPGGSDIPGVAGDTDVSDALVVRHAVERCVRLDEPAMLLALEQGDDVVATRQLHVEPR